MGGRGSNARGHTIGDESVRAAAVWPDMHLVDKNIGDRIADCFWSKLRDKGIGRIIEDLPDSLEKDLLEKALGEGLDKMKNVSSFAEAAHQIRATCGKDGVYISVFTTVSFAIDGQTFTWSTDEKHLGNCNRFSFDAGALYNLGCQCCVSSPFHPKYEEVQQ